MNGIYERDLDNLILDYHVSLMIHDKARKKIFLLVTAKTADGKQLDTEFSVPEQYSGNT